MPYNYLDFIRDQYRRQQGATARRKASYRGINTNPILGQGNEPYGSFRGEPLDRFDSGSTGNTGQVILGRQGIGQTEGNLREDASTFNRPRRLQGTGITDTEYKAIGYNPSAPTTYNAINAAPARQAIDTAVAGNAKLGNTGNRTVVNDNGTQTTYFASGGSATAKLPFGTNVSRTDNGHSVLDFPNGGRRIVSAEGQAFDYKPGSISDNTKDFANPVLNPNQAANYLGSSAAQSLLPQRGPAAYISPETEHQNPVTPLITQVPTTTQKENFSLGGLYHGGIQGLGQAAANLSQTTTNILDKLSKAAGNPRFRDKKDKDQY